MKEHDDILEELLASATGTAETSVGVSSTVKPGVKRYSYLSGFRIINW